MFFEITLIQRLTLFLGYPTYSLTVTLASILLFTGVGALLSARWQARAGRAVVPVLLGALAALDALLPVRPAPLTDALLGLPLAGARRLSRSLCSRRSASASACSCRSGWARSRASPRSRARVRRLGMGGQRLRLGDRRGAHDDPRHDLRLPASCSSSRSSSTASPCSRLRGLLRATPAAVPRRRRRSARTGRVLTGVAQEAPVAGA